MGGIGDLFRYFASPQQKQQIQILEALSQISNQLKNVEAKIDRVATTTSQVQFKQLTKDLDGGVIFQTLQQFAGVAQDCEGKTQPYAEDSVCESWLGNGRPAKFYESRLGKEMHTVANIPPSNILAAVQGRGAEQGLLQVMPDVISDRAATNKFFTSADSDQVQSYYSYYISVELAYIILYTNYWQSTPHPSNLDVNTKKKEFIASVRQQLRRFQPLPAGTAIDMRTGLMWTTNNTCLKNSLQPPTCGTGAGGFLLSASCPALGANCQLPTPATVSADSSGNKTAELEAAMNRSLASVAQTASDSSWKVPSKAELEGLMRSQADGFRRQLAPNGWDDRDVRGIRVGVGSALQRGPGRRAHQEIHRGAGPVRGGGALCDEPDHCCRRDVVSEGLRRRALRCRLHVRPCGAGERVHQVRDCEALVTSVFRRRGELDRP